MVNVKNPDYSQFIADATPERGLIRICYAESDKLVPVSIAISKPF